MSFEPPSPGDTPECLTDLSQRSRKRRGILQGLVGLLLTAKRARVDAQQRVSGCLGEPEHISLAGVARPPNDIEQELPGPAHVGGFRGFAFDP